MQSRSAERGAQTKNGLLFFTPTLITLYHLTPQNLNRYVVSPRYCLEIRVITAEFTISSKNKKYTKLKALRNLIA